MKNRNAGSCRRAVGLAGVMLWMLGGVCNLYADEPPCPLPLTKTECEIRSELKIPNDPSLKVVIVSETSHNDWDWIATFEQYYSSQRNWNANSVKSIYEALFGVPSGTPILQDHYYSICEVSYLERFLQDYPDLPPSLLDSPLLHIVGGGITSPSSLLSHGEAFIRNQLVGTQWVRKNLPRYSGQSPRLFIENSWLPDDFALDPNLPSILEAMDLRGVGFSRISGRKSSSSHDGSGGADFDVNAADFSAMPGSPADFLLEHGNGLDFFWQAPDGAKVFSHWLAGKYAQVYNSYDASKYQPADALVLNIDNDSSHSFTADNSDVCQLLQTVLMPAYCANQRHSRTRYTYLPVSNDAAMPLKNLAGLLEAVNTTCHPQSCGDVAPEATYLVSATFDHYARLVQAQAQAASPPLLNPMPFVSGPVADGMNASSPEVKQLHLAATQALLGAEAFEALAQQVNPDCTSFTRDWQWIQDGWKDLVPSTHHAYVTGLATRDVYVNEQLPYLHKAKLEGDHALKAARNALAAASPAAGSKDQAVVFNQNGFEATGLVEASLPPGGSTAASTQTSHQNTLLFLANAPSLGYSTVDLTSLPSIKDPVTVHRDRNTITMANRSLTATLKLSSKTSQWNLTSLRDGSTELLNGEANQLTVYQESVKSQNGNSFSFLFEGKEQPAHAVLETVGLSSTASPQAVLLESGPLRVWVHTTFESNGTQFSKDYVLVSGEPFLRMITSGAAAATTSVMTSFPLKVPGNLRGSCATKTPSTPSSPGSPLFLTYGTPYHWTTESICPSWQAFTGWQGPFFKPTFGFVMPRVGASGPPLLALYHQGAPAWGLLDAAQPSGTATLYGVLFRNVMMGEDLTSVTTDPDSHTVEYALRVPTGLAEASTGMPFRESLQYQQPLAGIMGSTVPACGKIHNIPTASLAKASLPAIITAAKPGAEDASSLILRTYVPTNQSTPVTLTLYPGLLADRTATEVSALEQPYRTDNPTNQRPSIGLSSNAGSNTLTFTAPRSLTTLQLKP